MTDYERYILWEAINAYTAACGGLTTITPSGEIKTIMNGVERVVGEITVGKAVEHIAGATTLGSGI